MKHLVFPKSRRLVSNRQFKTVLDRGRRAGDSLFVLYAARNDREHPRLGISVGRSSGVAVVRNRLKRLLREAFRQSQDRIPPEYDYVLMVAAPLSRRLKRPGDRASALAQLTFERVRKSFLSLVERATTDR